MTFLKDKLLIFIILTALLQLYIMGTMGEWETKIEQKGASEKNKNRFKLADGLWVESEHTISEKGRIVGTHTYFVTDKCFTIERLTISMAEISGGNVVKCKRVKTRIDYLSQFELDSENINQDENLLKGTNITICPDQRIEISNWFEYPDEEAANFQLRYLVTATGNGVISGLADLTKKTRFEVNGQHHYDFIILLYPVLWGILALLTLVKVIRVVVKITGA